MIDVGGPIPLWVTSFLDSWSWADKKTSGGGGRWRNAQLLRPFLALPEHPNSAPNTPNKWLTAICIFTFRGSDTFSWPLQTPPHM